MTDTGWLWPNSVITNVVDGDTIDARLTRDIGFGGTTTFVVRLRLNRINAPAKSSAVGKKALAAVNTHVGETVTIETRKPYKFGGPDKSPGEWMAEVTLSDGTNLSDWLVTNYLAVLWDGEGPRPEVAA
jgi:endonuclease YncB( thermonuclease family)